MDATLKSAAWSLAKSVVDRAVVGAGVALLSHGVLVPAQVTGFDQVISGLVMIVLGALVGWYRDHGKALAQAEIDRLNTKIDAMTKAIQVPHPSKS